MRGNRLARGFAALRLLGLFALERASYHTANIVGKHFPKLWEANGLKLNKQWLASANALRAIEFETWQSGASQFPQPGWWSRGRLDDMSEDSNKASLINACLAHPELKWGTGDPSGIDDIQRMLSYKARQACQSDLSAFAASYVFEKIPKSCDSHRSFFRDELSANDPDWHMRESTGNLATFLRANDPDYSSEIQRQRQDQQAHVERQEIEAVAPEAPPAASRAKSRRI